MACLVSAVFLVCFVDKLFSPPYYLFGKMFPPILRANLPLLSVNGKTNLIIIFMLIPRTCCCCCCWSVFALFMALLIRRGIRLSSDGRRCGLQFDGGDFATWRRLVHWWMFGSKLAWTLLAVFDLVCEKLSPEMEKFSRKTQNIKITFSEFSEMTHQKTKTIPRVIANNLVNIERNDVDDYETGTQNK